MWRDWGLSSALKGHFEHAEGKEEDFLGCRHKSRGLAIRRAMCFELQKLDQPESNRGLTLALGGWGCEGNLEDLDG